MPENNNTTAPQRVRRRGQRMTAEEKRIAKDTFLKTLSNTANVRAACMAAGIDSSTVYRWQEHDDEFSLLFKQENQNANWLLFGEAWRRAVHGEERYYVSQGKVVYGPDGKPATYREKSDRLLELLLKARLPEFRDKQSIDMNVSLSDLLASEHTSLLSDLAALPDVSQSQEQDSVTATDTD